MAEIDWKGAIWKSSYGELSVKELLTTLKGYGPMENLDFEKPGICKGRISLCFSPEGEKEVTLYDLEIYREKRKGEGMATLRWLRTIFRSSVFVDCCENPPAKETFQGTLLFWLKAYREGLIDGIECESFCLSPNMTQEDLNRIEKTILNRSTLSHQTVPN